MRQNIFRLIFVLFIFQKVRVFQQGVEEASARVIALEAGRARWTPPGDAREARAQAAGLRARPAPASALRDLPQQVTALQRARVPIANHLLLALDDLTARFVK